MYKIMSKLRMYKICRDKFCIPKWVNIMRLTFVLTVLFVINVHGSTRAQSISLNVKNEVIEQVLRMIEEQTDFRFFFSNDCFDADERVSFSVNEGELETVLEDLLDERYKYEILGNLIVISVNENLPQNRKVEIKGHVKDKAGQPLPGATVQIKGTTVGVATDIDGNFLFAAQLPADQKSVVLSVSFVGFKSKEVTVHFPQKQPAVIVLEDESVQMESVVVTGYQKIDRKMFTGSASVMKAEGNLLQGLPDVTSSLQGQIAGVSVNNVSSTFGAAPQVTIRGNSSIHGDNKPLWVVDGVVLEDLINVSSDDLTSGNLSTLLSSGVAGLNPDDIESFQVLKDVSATSLYGAQAMNGVIVITTKSGRKGAVSVNYAGTVSVRERPSYADFNIMNSVDEVSVYKELVRKGWIGMTSTAKAKNYGVIGKMYDLLAQKQLTWDKNGLYNEDFLEKYANANTDWFDILFRNSVTQQHSLSITGGGEKSRFYASFSYYHDNGTTIADKVDRYTFSLKGDIDISPKMNIGLKLSANVRDQKVPGTKNRSFDPTTGAFSRDFDINPFSYALNTARSMRAYDDNGDLEYFRSDYAPFNILYELDHNYVDMSVTDVSAQADLKYNPIKGLSLGATFSMRRASTLQEYKIHETSNQAEAYRAASTESITTLNKFLFTDPQMPGSNPYTILPEGGFYNTDENTLQHLYAKFQGEYGTTFLDAHSINVLVGFELNSTDRQNRWNDGWGYVYDKGGVVVMHDNLSRYLNTRGQSLFGYSELFDRRISAFTNVAYSFLGKYVFNAGFRYDGSNQLGSDRQARYLPSWNVSGAWNMTEEGFLYGVDWLSNLRPKISYGYNGIMGPSTSSELMIYAQQTLRPDHNETGNYIESLANKDLTWEKMYELNVGLEYGFLMNRIAGEFAYYKRKSVDLIDLVYTSGIGGSRIKIGNIGDMKAHGFEFSLNTINIQTDRFKWTTNFNFNYHESEITKLEQSAQIADAVSNLGAAVLHYPQSALFSIRFAGLNGDGVPTFYDQNDNIIYDLDMQSRDDLDKILKYEGPLEPKFYGGFANNFIFRGFNLGINFVYKAGNVIRLDDAFASSYTDYRSFPKELKNRWMLPGDEKVTTIPAILDQRTYQKYSSVMPYEMYNKSTERVAKGDFIRLKDISLSYAFPAQMLKKTFIKSASLGFQATNVWLLYSDKKLNGVDPEFYFSGGVSLPVSRMYSFSLNIGF